MKVEVNRKRAGLLRYNDVEVKITAESGGKTRKYQYHRLPPEGSFPDLVKRSVTSEEFSQHVELLKLVMQDKMTVRQKKPAWTRMIDVRF
jgi:hypothetical protein